MDIPRSRASSCNWGEVSNGFVLTTIVKQDFVEEFKTENPPLSVVLNDAGQYIATEVYIDKVAMLDRIAQLLGIKPVTKPVKAALKPVK